MNDKEASSVEDTEARSAMKLAFEEMKIGNYNSAAERLEAALAKQEQGEQLAKLGWQEIDCPICGGGARAFPKQEQGEPVDYKEQARKGCGSCSYQYCDYPDCVKRKTK